MYKSSKPVIFSVFSIILRFTTLDLDRDDVNHTIREAGFSAIHSIKQIVKLKEIPVLGTGKTDYRSLKTMSVN